MKILFAAAEVTPLAKNGGLGDVVAGLPLALSRQQIDVRIVIPGYAQVLSQLSGQTPLSQFKFFIGEQPVEVEVWQTLLPSSHIPVYCLKFSPGLTDPGIYALQPDLDQDRFMIFGLAVIAWLKQSDWQPDIMHVHDWMTSSLAHEIQQQHLPYKTVITIHNANYQGAIDAHWARDLGLDYPEDAEGKINLMQLGISAADKITAVSPTYAQELLTAERSKGLEGIFQQRQADLVGILNGLDQQRFSPQTSGLQPSYQIETAVEVKAEHKRQLCQELGFDVQLPLYAVVTRATGQKGMEVLAEVINHSHFLDQAQLVILCYPGNKKIEGILTDLAERYPGNICLKLGYYEAMSPQVFAAADFLIMPSKYEPCGLTQMIAMRYGTVPIVHRTGGLLDTVPDIALGDQGLGITFDNYTAASLLGALERSLKLYQQSELLEQVVHRDMDQDFSWDHSLPAYLDVYRQLVQD